MKLHALIQYLETRGYDVGPFYTILGHYVSDRAKAAHEAQESAVTRLRNLLKEVREGNCEDVEDLAKLIASLEID